MLAYVGGGRGPCVQVVAPVLGPAERQPSAQVDLEGRMASTITRPPGGRRPCPSNTQLRPSMRTAVPASMAARSASLAQTLGRATQAAPRVSLGVGGLEVMGGQFMAQSLKARPAGG
jgi:hypothetical protein